MTIGRDLHEASKKWHIEQMSSAKNNYCSYLPLGLDFGLGFRAFFLGFLPNSFVTGVSCHDSILRDRRWILQFASASRPSWSESFPTFPNGTHSKWSHGMGRFQPHKLLQVLLVHWKGPTWMAKSQSSFRQWTWTSRKCRSPLFRIFPSKRKNRVV